MLSGRPLPPSSRDQARSRLDHSGIDDTFRNPWILLLLRAHLPMLSNIRLVELGSISKTLHQSDCCHRSDIRCLWTERYCRLVTRYITHIRCQRLADESETKEAGFWNPRLRSDRVYRDDCATAIHWIIGAKLRWLRR